MEYNITLKTLETVRNSRTIKSHDQKLPEAPLRQFRQAFNRTAICNRKVWWRTEKSDLQQKIEGRIDLPNWATR